MFKVVPDQLRISDGWVRCGQCDEVFDANAQVVSDIQVVDASPGDAIPSQPAPIAPSPPPAEDVARPTEPVAPASPLMPAELTSAPPAEVSEAEADAAEQEDEQKSEVVQEALTRSAPISVPVKAPDPEPAPRASLDSTLSAALAEQRWNAEAQAAAAEELSFMAAEKGSTLWHTPTVRAGLALIAILLVVVLALQFMVRERDRIVAIEPAARPLLEQVCALMACRIEPLRQIDSVVIDSSAFVKVRGDVYRLSFALKNSAQWELAVPALELTLTDAQDQAVIRRVFVASDFAGKQQAMGANAELAASMPVAVKQVANADRIAGYRLVAFYP